MSELSRDDLFLLMKSYENTVKSNQTLLEQQKRLLENHSILLEKESQVIENTSEILRKQQDLQKNLVNLLDKMTTYSTSCDDKTDKVIKIVDNNTIENIKSHSTLKIRLIYVYAGITTVVIGLIGLVERMWTKSSVIIKVLEGIAKQLGVSP